MKRKVRIDVPTLWLFENGSTLRIVWPDESVLFLGHISGQWRPSVMPAGIVRKHSYYCGPLFVSKENEP